MKRMRSTIVGVAILCTILPAAALARVGRALSDPPEQPGPQDPASTLDHRLRTLEQAVAADPENLAQGAEYRQVTIAAGMFDRAIDFFRRLTRPADSGPNVKINLALAYVDKVPTAGDIRRLYLGRDAMNALTQAIAVRPSVLAYYMRGQINLYYNRLIFHRTDKGVADLTQALSMVTKDTPPALVARVYAALGDGYFRLENLSKAREVWSTGLTTCPGDPGLKTRLESSGQALLEVVTAALSAGRRSDTSLAGWLPGT
jgi:tetratricopeptide (TPR) repeat protein